MSEYKDFFLGAVGSFEIKGSSFYIDGSRKPLPSLGAKILEIFQQHLFSSTLLQSKVSELPKIANEIAADLRKGAETPKLVISIDAESAEARDKIESDLQIVIDPTSSDFYTCNNSDNLFNPIGPAYMAKMSKKERDLCYIAAPYMVKIFDPRSNAPKEVTVNTPSGNKTYPAVNTFIKPPFMFQEDKGEKLHNDHKTFINLRFTDSTSKEIYLSSLYHMITDRMRHCIFLVHPREGTGKTIAMGEIPAALIGPMQSASLPPSIITSPFNGILEGKRHILLDEFKLQSRNENLFKKMTEDPLFINAKHKLERNIYNAMTIFGTSNKYNIFTLPSNRRNVFLEDSGKHIIEETSQEWVSAYVHRLKNDPDFVANLGYWILRNFKDTSWTPTLTYQGPTFERMVYETCSIGFKFIIHRLKDEDETSIGDEYNYIELREDFDRGKRKGKNESYFPSIESVIDFFKDYREGGKPIATTKRIDNSEDIVIRRV